MSATLEIINEGRLLKLALVAPWNMNDIFQLFPRIEQHLDNSTFQVNTLVDISKMGSIPAGVLRLRNNPLLAHPNNGYQIIVGANTYAKKMSDILFRLTKNDRVRFFATMDDAWAFLQTVETSVVE